MAQFKIYGLDPKIEPTASSEVAIVCAQPQTLRRMANMLGISPLISYTTLSGWRRNHGTIHDPVHSTD